MPLSHTQKGWSPNTATSAHRAAIAENEHRDHARWTKKARHFCRTLPVDGVLNGWT
jgi:hypothetical protein